MRHDSRDILKKVIYPYNGFTLIEVMVGIVIVTIVMTSGFQALNSVGVGKIKIIESSEIEKQGFFATEKFFEMVKKGGSLDFEEYWNRKIIGDSTFTGGRYTRVSGFGNYGTGGTVGTTNFAGGYYSCISGNGIANKFASNGCVENTTTGRNTLGVDLSGSPQFYGQYAEQFIDRNSDFDSDGGNEDGDLQGNIIGDDDDAFLGEGPDALSSNRTPELYLINQAGTERTYFRWNVVTDPNAPGFTNCDLITNPDFPVGDGCLGTVEFLKLVGSDEGYDHSNSGTLGDNDGIIDTWRIHPDFSLDGSSPIAGIDTNNYWQKIFSDSINVSLLNFYIYPIKDGELAWKDGDKQVQIHPHIGLQIDIEPSWKVKRQIKGQMPSSQIRTYISLLSNDIQ